MMPISSSASSSPVPAVWYNWLMTVTLGVLLFGLSMIFLSGLIQLFFNWLVYSTVQVAAFPADAQHYSAFVYGILGAVMVGWSISLLYIIVSGFRRGERAAWLALALSVSTWFALDSGYSLAMGFAQNALFNVGFMILFAIPLIGSRRYFYEVSRDMSRDTARR